MFDFRLPDDLSWRECRIPKKGKPGEFRKITIPNDELKDVQRLILQYLYTVKDLRATVFAHGFVPFRSTSTGVDRLDRRAPWILCMDVHDFFDTFPLEPIRERMKEAGVPDRLAEKIMTACTFNGTIPQGGPCSPFLTNVGMLEADKELSAYAKRIGCTYMRYADDITFAAKDGECAVDFSRKGARIHVFRAVDALLHRLLGLHLKMAKNHAIRLDGNKPRRVLGVVIRKDGKGYNAPRELRRRVRAMLHNLARKVRAQRGRMTDEDCAQWKKVEGYARYFDALRSHGDGEASSADTVLQERYWRYCGDAYARKHDARRRQHAAGRPGQGAAAARRRRDQD